MIYKLYSEYEVTLKEETRNQIEPLKKSFEKVRDLSKAKNNKLLNTLKTFAFDYVSPQTIISYLTGGTSNSAYKLIYEDLIRNPYSNQVGEKVKFLKLRDSILKNVVKHQFDYTKSKIKTVDGKTIKIRKYVLYQFYLNTLSNDNLLRMKNSNLTYTDKVTSKISFDELNNHLDELKDVEKQELNKLFDLYNNELKSYVEKISERLYGFTTTRQNYYPIVASDAFKIKDFTNPFSMRYSIDATTNGRLKALTNNKTVIEANINPINLFNDYVESMTITGEIGLASQKLNRIFNLKIDGENIMSVVSQYLPNAKLYISSLLNKLINNTDTIQRSGFFDKTIGKFATAQLGVNISSMLKQPASFFTAWLKTGVGVGVKTILNPTTYYRMFKNASWLKANNNIFANRIYDHGYVSSVTLSAGPNQFANTWLRKITSTALFGMEMLDRMTCYSTFVLAQNYANKLYGSKIGSEINLKQASEMFNDIMLETQSNSDRIAMSRIRSGEKGSIIKKLFGLFASDSQNKASILVNLAINAVNQKREIVDSKKKINVETDAENKSSMQGELSNLHKQLKTTGKGFATYATATILSSIVVVLAVLLRDWLYDREEPEETDFSNLLTELLSESTISLIPYISAIYNWFKYDEISFASFDNIEGLIQNINKLIDGGFSKEDILQVALDLATFMGIPVNNLYNLINGIIGNFVPSEAYKFRSLFYGASQSYLSSELKSKLKLIILLKQNPLYL